MVLADTALTVCIFLLKLILLCSSDLSVDDIVSKAIDNGYRNMKFERTCSNTDDQQLPRDESKLFDFIRKQKAFEENTSNAGRLYIEVNKELVRLSGKSIHQLIRSKAYRESFGKQFCRRTSLRCEIYVNSPYRSADGRCNNIRYPTLGSKGAIQSRYLPPQYDDGITKPRERSGTGKALLSPRIISNEVFRGLGTKEITPKDNSLSLMTFTWGQFIDHDIVLTPVATTNCPVLSLLSELLKSADENFNLKKAVEAMGDVNAKTYGLSEAADANIIARYSRAMSKDIVQVIGAPELFMKVSIATKGLTLTSESVFPAVSAAVQKLPKLPDTHKNHVSPVDIFVHFEVEGYKKLVERVHSDLAVVQRASKGEAVPLQTLEGVIHGLNSDQVPQAWLSLTFPSCISLTKWIEELPKRLQTISSYITERAGVYNIASFLRPDRFFEAVKHQYARKHFKDVNSIQLQIQVMPAGLYPTLPPKDGAFITGLRLYNALWDTARGMLMSGASDKQSCQDMPVIWLKPIDISSPSSVSIKHQQYDCPLFCSADQRCHSHAAMVTELPLPTLLDPSVWHQNRVFLATHI